VQGFFTILSVMRAGLFPGGFTDGNGAIDAEEFVRVVANHPTFGMVSPHLFVIFSPYLKKASLYVVFCKTQWS
jgi:hypothetical protein